MVYIYDIDEILWWTIFCESSNVFNVAFCTQSKPKRPEKHTDEEDEDFALHVSAARAEQGDDQEDEATREDNVESCEVNGENVKTQTNI